jgi:hypothetical protein
MLEALQIEQAVDGTISLPEIPATGATALIPELLDPDPENTISIFISGHMVVDAAPLGNLVGKFYRHNIKKKDLLDLSGPGRNFYYFIYNFAGNEESSGIVTYSIVH